MLNEMEMKMHQAFGKDVRVTCKDGTVIEGHCTDFIQAIDNEPEVTEIGVLRGTMNLVGITEPEIEKIEYLD
ncbi:Uncharacterised protein [Blautia hydrogenotrophica]|uniref:hypothetical protein n=1 Tax=Blautia hydrogenotrophica TaxID=53443 RepID=UPI0006C5BE1D|nr:hypothetical protein [Blautia hydrogenotrophica]CUN17441.1 Uncharacterised protein [Blautia hydrogenotrophica]SCI23214.1 Uncharacterised protein [uncultured Blautia sp.]